MPIAVQIGKSLEPLPSEQLSCTLAIQILPQLNETCQLTQHAHRAWALFFSLFFTFSVSPDPNGSKSHSLRVSVARNVARCHDTGKCWQGSPCQSILVR